MALVTKTIPNLMNGVSQQPKTVRLPNQCNEQINAMARVSDGLSKRMPVSVVASARYENMSLDPYLWNSTDCRMITVSGKTETGVNRKANVMIHAPTGTIAYQFLDGAKESGFVAENVPYIQGSTGADIKFLLNGSNLYVLNKSKTVTLTYGDSTSDMRKQGCLGVVKNGFFGTTYELEVQLINSFGSLVATTGTLSFTTNSSSATTNITELQTTHIANNSTNGLGKQLEDFVANVANVDFNTKCDVVRDENWFQIKLKDAYTGSNRLVMKCVSTTAETAIIAFNGVASDPVKLPKEAPDGFVMKIDADPTSPEDHYYLQFDRDVNGWVESVSKGLADQWDSDTLPLIVSVIWDDPTLNASYTPIVLEGREVGDREVNPDPSFVNSTINDIFIFNNRLGFLSGNNIILSRIDNFNLFFRSSCAVSLAADRVDLKAAVPSARYTDLLHSVPFETSILLFGETAQYALQTNVGFDVTKTSLQTTTEYEADALCPPVNLGSVVYFPVRRGNHTAIFDLSRKDGIGLTAEEVTHHIPTYIQGRAVEATFSTTENIYFVRTEDEPRTIYVQNRFVRQATLEQNAWGKWTMPNDILYMRVVGTNLMVTMVAADEESLIHAQIDITTQRIESTESLTIDFTPFLDLLQLVPEGETLVAGDSGLGGYFIPTEHTSSLVGVKANGQSVLGLTAINAALADEPLWVGVPYTFSYTFSEQVPQAVSESERVAQLYGKLTLRNMRLTYTNSGRFDIVVTPTGRTAQTTPYSGYVLGTSLLGKINVGSGEFKFPINSRANAVEIKIQSDYPYPCTFNTAEWQGMFTLNTGRM